MNSLNIDAAHTALVAIDLQNSNLERKLLPHSASLVLENSIKIADALRTKGGTVIWVRVDVGALLTLPADKPLSRPVGAPPPHPSASQLAPALLERTTDTVVTKRNWGAFYGTDLDLHLQRGNIRTVIMAGIATNFGVESTARGAFDRGYELIFAEDAMSSVSTEMHQASNERVFPHMGKVRATAEIVATLDRYIKR